MSRLVPLVSRRAISFASTRARTAHVAPPVPWATMPTRVQPIVRSSRVSRIRSLV